MSWLFRSFETFDSRIAIVDRSVEYSYLQLGNQIDEFILGQLMAYFMMETIAACHLIGVDPFNQPAVEQGKKLTIEYLLGNK